MAAALDEPDRRKRHLDSHGTRDVPPALPDHTHATTPACPLAVPDKQGEIARTGTTASR